MIVMIWFELSFPVPFHQPIFHSDYCCKAKPAIVSQLIDSFSTLLHLELKAVFLSLISQYVLGCNKFCWSC